MNLLTYNHSNDSHDHFDEIFLVFVSSFSGLNRPFLETSSRQNSKVQKSALLGTKGLSSIKPFPSAAKNDYAYDNSN